MTLALVRKELRLLLPVLMGMAALLLWSLVDGFLIHPPDHYASQASGWLLNPHSGRLDTMASLVVALLIAYNLLPGEHEQRTIEFLYTLPVRRRTIFLTKYAVGVGVLVAFNVLGTVEGALHRSLNASSFGRALYPPHFYLLIIAVGDTALSFVVVAYAFLLSFFRRLGWMLFLLVWLALELCERLSPSLRLLHVRALLDVEHRGLTPILDGRAWQIHGAMAALALALAARLWLGDATGFAGWYERLRQQAGLRRAAVALGLVAATVLSAGVMALWGGSVPVEEGPAAQRTLTFETEHFHFTYREGRAERAMIVIREAERAYRRIHEWLPGPTGDVGDKIVADLTDSSGEHLGIAGWQKMRLDLRPKSPELLRHVLYHETTHVLAHQAGGSSARDAAPRFFSEGLAEYVAYELDPAPAERAHARRIAALARDRYQLRLQDLMEPAAFVARHDEFLLYALGELWVAALVDACGPGLPAQVVKTFADESLSQRLGGLELWRVVLQRNGCDLDRVTSRYEQHLRQLLPSSTALPVASARWLGEEGGRLRVQLSVQAPTPGPWLVTLRLRSDPSTPPDDIVTHTRAMTVGTPEPLELLPPPFTGKRLELQVGAARDADTRPFFTRWQSVTR